MKPSEPLPGVRVWEFGLDVPQDDMNDCERLLSSDERERAARYVLPVVRSRFIVARARLRSILGEILGVPGDQPTFTYAEHGKPYLAPPWHASGYRFNLAHSADRALLAVARDHDIGCDLETHRGLRYGPAVARRFFSEGENAELSQYDGEAWTEAFFRIWTLKEAFVKAHGAGLTFPTRSFTVTIQDGEANCLVAVEREPKARERWHLQSIETRQKDPGAVCLTRA